MQIVVVDVAQIQKRVSFRCDYGAATAQWQVDGDSRAPRVGDRFDVEIDVRDVLQWGCGVRLEGDGQASIRDAGSQVVLAGIIEAVDACLITLRLGPAVISIETRGTVPQGASAGAPVC